MMRVQVVLHDISGHGGMANIVVTQSGTTVAVKNGDRVVIDIPGGGDVTIVAANANTRNFQVEFTDDTLADTLLVDLSTFSKDGLQILARDYDPTDRITLIGKTSGGIAPGQLSNPSAMPCAMSPPSSPATSV